jgi:hypothetical protein
MADRFLAPEGLIVPASALPVPRAAPGSPEPIRLPPEQLGIGTPPR